MRKMTAGASTRDLTAAEWQDVWNQLVSARQAYRPNKNSPPPMADEDALPAAQLYYSQTQNLPPEIVAKLNPLEVIGPYYFEHYEQVQDDTFKLMNLPYPQLRAMLPHQAAEIKQLKESEPHNLFAAFTFISDFSRCVETFSRVDKNVAALMVVEAIRTYAAANNGQLPQHLADITDIPVPDNPQSGRPFDYVVNGDRATLSDRDPAATPLRFTIKIRH